MLAVTPLVSSEGSPHRGAELWLAVAWCGLLVLWGVQALLQKELEIRWSWVETYLAALLAWLAISTWTVAGDGNLRAAFNAFWDHAHLLVGYFLIRQCLVTQRQRQAMMTVMVGIATLISSYALYQYAVVMPANRAAYQADPETYLRGSGIDPTPGNPTRTLFESRLSSTEPTGTFTLTNSLAGFLVPWILLGVGWLKESATSPQERRRTLGAAAALLLLGLCLLLTKSRTAWLATLLGLFLIGVYATGVGKRISWKIPALGLTLFLSLFMLGFVIGVLDVEVLSEAPKSVIYRLQYWQGAAQIIAEHPLFGCGLANFQGYYPQFMLPMASETVADPHNFVFEIWATAGTPAILFLLAAMGAWCWQVARSPADAAVTISGGEFAVAKEDSDRPIWIGGVLAVLVAPFLQSVMQEVLPDLMVILVGIIPAAGVVFALSQPGQSDAWRRWPVIAVAALVVNLLAAGGISFPSVAGSLYLLAAISLPSQPTRKIQQGAIKALPLGLGVIALLTVVYWGVQPVTARKTHVAIAADAASRGNWPRVQQQMQLAAQADRWSQEGPAGLADVHFQAYFSTPAAQQDRRQELLDQFEIALEEATRRSGRSFPLHFSAGHRYLDIYRASGDTAYLQKAVARYREAADLFPARAIHHAQLAWALHLLDETEASRAAAEEALRLDHLNPHAERRLEIAPIHDVPAAQVPADQPPTPPEGRSAKQVAEALRIM